MRTINPQSLTIYPCEGQGSVTCDTVRSCAYISPCCNIRQDIIRSNYSTSLEFAKAVARELEKVIQGCTSPSLNQYCYTDYFCYQLGNATNQAIGTSFRWCTHNNSTTPYSCGNQQYNVDITVELQDLMIEFILDQYVDPQRPACPLGYTQSLHKVDINVCMDNSINCVEFPYCFNMFLTAEFTYKCCNNSQNPGQ